MSGQQISSAVLLVIMLMISAGFSICETAYSSSNGIRLKKMAQEGGKREKRAYDVYLKSTAAITSILIGNTIVNIVATTLSAILFSSLFGALGVIIATGVLTAIILVFCEIAPKTIAKSKPEAFAVKVALPMQILITLFYPLSTLVVYAQTKWEEKQGIVKITATEGELLEIVATIEKEGILVQDERELIERVIAFDETKAGQIMVDKEEVIFIKDNITKDELKEVVRLKKRSRYPVISHETKQIIGVLKIKDIITQLLEGHEMDICSALHKPIYVSKRQRLPKILDEVQRNRSHMIIVTENVKSKEMIGIVTLEDILEELVGEIYDEYDTLPNHVVEYGHSTFEVDANVSLVSFFDEYLEGHPLPTGAPHYIGDWVNTLFNGKPRLNKEVNADRLTIKVTRLKDGQIEKIEIHASSILD